MVVFYRRCPYSYSHRDYRRGCRTYTRVLRYEPGDSILCDGAGEYPAVIIETGKDRLIARLGMVTRQRVNRMLKWFYIKAYPKLQNGYNNPMCKLGIHSIIPLNTSRTVVNLSKLKIHKRVERWQRLPGKPLSRQ